MESKSRKKILRSLVLNKIKINSKDKKISNNNNDSLSSRMKKENSNLINTVKLYSNNSRNNYYSIYEYNDRKTQAIAKLAFNMNNYLIMSNQKNHTDRSTDFSRHKSNSNAITYNENQAGLNNIDSSKSINNKNNNSLISRITHLRILTDIKKNTEGNKNITEKKKSLKKRNDKNDIQNDTIINNIDKVHNINLISKNRMNIENYKKKLLNENLIKSKLDNIRKNDLKSKKNISIKNLIISENKKISNDLKKSNIPEILFDLNKDINKNLEKKNRDSKNEIDKDSIKKPQQIKIIQFINNSTNVNIIQNDQISNQFLSSFNKKDTLKEFSNKISLKEEFKSNELFIDLNDQDLINKTILLNQTINIEDINNKSFLDIQDCELFISQIKDFESILVDYQISIKEKDCINEIFKHEDNIFNQEDNIFNQEDNIFNQEDNIFNQENKILENEDNIFNQEDNIFNQEDKILENEDNIFNHHNDKFKHEDNILENSDKKLKSLNQSDEIEEEICYIQKNKYTKIPEFKVNHDNINHADNLNLNNKKIKRLNYILNNNSLQEKFNNSSNIFNESKEGISKNSQYLEETFNSLKKSNIFRTNSDEIDNNRKVFEIDPNDKFIKKLIKINQNIINTLKDELDEIQSTLSLKKEKLSYNYISYITKMINDRLHERYQNKLTYYIKEYYKKNIRMIVKDYIKSEEDLVVFKYETPINEKFQLNKSVSIHLNKNIEEDEYENFIKFVRSLFEGAENFNNLKIKRFIANLRKYKNFKTNMHINRYLNFDLKNINNQLYDEKENFNIKKETQKNMFKKFLKSMTLRIDDDKDVCSQNVIKLLNEKNNLILSNGLNNRRFTLQKLFSSKLDGKKDESLSILVNPLIFKKIKKKIKSKHDISKSSSDENEKIDKTRKYTMNRESVIYRTHEIKSKSVKSCTDVMAVLKFYIKDREYIKFKKIFEHSNFYVNQRDMNQDTLLILASKSNCYEIVEYLLIKDADINLSDRYSNTALHYALKHKHFKIANLLISKKPDEKAINYLGYTPWMYLNYDSDNENL